MSPPIELAEPSGDDSDANTGSLSQGTKRRSWTTAQLVLVGIATLLVIAAAAWLLANLWEGGPSEDDSYWRTIWIWVLVAVTVVLLVAAGGVWLGVAALKARRAGHGLAAVVLAVAGAVLLVPLLVAVFLVATHVDTDDDDVVPEGVPVPPIVQPAPPASSEPTTTSVPPTSPPPGKTVEQVRTEIQTDIESWRDPSAIGTVTVVCEGSGAVGYGDVHDCTAEAWTPEGAAIQPAHLTVVIVDQGGTWAAHGGSDNPTTAYLASLPEMNCDQALQQWWVPPDPTTGYLELLAYFFVHDQTPLMDIDGNGVPCETVVSPDAINTVYAGGSIS